MNHVDASMPAKEGFASFRRFADGDIERFGHAL
jgi:hypothetical protein